MKTLTRIILLVLAIAVDNGCDDGVAGAPPSAPPMRYHSAVVVAFAGGDSAISPVSVRSPDGQPIAHRGGLNLQQGDIQILYQFIGRGDYWIPGTEPQQSDQADVYLFRMRIAGRDAVNRTVLFTGEAQTVYAVPLHLDPVKEADDLKVIIKPAAGNEEPGNWKPSPAP